MKLPQTFLPEKNLDNKIKNLAKTRKPERKFHEIYKIEELIEEKIGPYSGDFLFRPSEPPYRYISSVAEHVRVLYHSTLKQSKSTEVIIFRMNSPAKDHVEEFSDEIDQGLLEDNNACFLIKDEFAIVLIAYTGNPKDLRLFKKHYKTKFGFC